MVSQAAPVQLVALRCVRCDTPVPAEPDEVAWTCTQCGQGLLLFKEQELVPIHVYYSTAIPANGNGRPFWVAAGKVQLARQVYGGGAGRQKEAEQFWGAGRRFFIPAFANPLENLLSLAMQYLQQPPALQEGPIVPYEAVTVDPSDAQALAEYIVLVVEAGRKDNLKAVDVRVELEPPDLWILA
jgi:hypothetical protein